MKWLRAIAIDGAMFGLLWAWLWFGIDGAGNVFRVAFWCLMTLALMIGLSGVAVWKSAAERTKAFRVYHGLTDLLLVVALAWFGHTLMAAFMIVAKGFYEAGYSVEMKRRKAEAKE